ncbi:MAG: ATP-binding cassette domain-containing protein [Pseudomonadota bacterium]
MLLVIITVANQILTAARVQDANLTNAVAQRYAEQAQRASEIVRSQGMLNPVTERWMAHRIGALQKNMTAVDWTGAFSTFTKAFRLSLQSLVLALGAYLVLLGEITAGAMIAASILLGRALAPIEQLVGRWPQITAARQGWASLKGFLGELEDPIERTTLPRPESKLQVSAVTITPGLTQPPILYNVSFEVAPGEAVGIIGRSGSGKTTIAKAVLGLIPPNVGEIRFGGAELAHYDPAALGAYIGYLPQDPMLMTGTIAENIARMSLEPDSEKIIAAAKKAMAHELILSLPDGYETQIEGNTSGLSGGQRQRIALARALYDDPVLLVLDEPNSALDQQGSDALNAAVRTLKSEGRSVLIMTHRPVAISECDRLIVVDSGKIKADGPRDEIIKSMMKNSGAVQRVVAGGTS